MEADEEHAGGVILTWNPVWWDAWTPPYDKQRALLSDGRPVPKTRWSVGRHRYGLTPGMHAWLYRQGARDRGIHAYAKVMSEPYEDLHWRGADRLAMYVDVAFKTLLPVEQTIPVPVLEDVVPGVHWRSMRQSGTILDPEATGQLQKLWLEWSDEVN